MKYLLDTCVLSDFVKGDENTVKKIKETSPSAVAISVITIMEVEYGVQLIPGKKSDSIKKVMNDLFQVVTVIPLCKEIATISASIRANLHKLGKPIGYYDILIGATAGHYNLIMVTSNTAEFNRIEKLKIQNWRD